MRRVQPEQLGLVPAFHDHIHSREVEAISRILDEHPEAAKWVHDDLVRNQDRHISARRGRAGMSGEQVLRVSDGTSPNEFLVEVGPRRTLHRVPAGT